MAQLMDDKLRKESFQRPTEIPRNNQPDKYQYRRNLSDVDIYRNQTGPQHPNDDRAQAGPYPPRQAYQEGYMPIYARPSNFPGNLEQPYQDYRKYESPQDYPHGMIEHDRRPQKDYRDESYRYPESFQYRRPERGYPAQGYYDRYRDRQQMYNGGYPEGEFRRHQEQERQQRPYEQRGQQMPPFDRYAPQEKDMGNPHYRPQEPHRPSEMGYSHQRTYEMGYPHFRPQEMGHPHPHLKPQEMGHQNPHHQPQEMGHPHHPHQPQEMRHPHHPHQPQEMGHQHAQPKIMGHPHPHNNQAQLHHRPDMERDDYRDRPYYRQMREPYRIERGEFQMGGGRTMTPGPMDYNKGRPIETMKSMYLSPNEDKYRNEALRNRSISPMRPNTEAHNRGDINHNNNNNHNNTLLSYSSQAQIRRTSDLDGRRM